MKETEHLGLNGCKDLPTVYSGSDFVLGEYSVRMLAKVASLVSSFQPWVGNEGLGSSFAGGHCS